METLKENNSNKKKIFFEEADRPPPSYYDGSLEKMPLKRIPFQTPDPESWLKAPEFVPRRKILEEAFASLPGCRQDRSPLTEVPFVPIGHLAGQVSMDKYIGAPPLISPPPAPYVAPPFPPMVAMPPATASSHPMPVIPNGYTVNITNINQGGGPPIPAIVLRKKRRKRNKQTQSLVMNSSESSSPSHPLDPNGYGSDRNGGTTTPNPSPIKEDEETADVSKQLLSGSCPDLSDEQLEIWDDYLYAATVNSKENKQKTSSPPKSPEPMVSPKSQKSSRNDLGELSVYDVIPRSLRDVAEQQLDGFSNPEIRRLDREINGNHMSSSMVMKQLAERRYHDSDGSTQRSLAAEMEELTFRPAISKYGYPQIDAERVQLATFHHNTVRSQMATRRFTSDSESDQCEEDCFEGMNITVNTFDTCDDLTLSDIEKAPSRFEQIHQTLKQNTLRYAELRPPQRVCCTIM
ncbi:hypothetical protein KIN20_006532 [Parelaphostrongylus tenuis]|uniref:Uncharacterized protein n=1 Tax=Parelaphostrongylus tenuis TaxID=148309 RepID=A0AAD5M3Q6_PARTN|nr:hypothetical protein KIN20_006532 [Parelaphostrongylus tenuis]